MARLERFLSNKVKCQFNKGKELSAYRKVLTGVSLSRQGKVMLEVIRVNNYSEHFIEPSEL